MEKKVKQIRNLLSKYNLTCAWLTFQLKKIDDKITFREIYSCIVCSEYCPEHILDLSLDILEMYIVYFEKGFTKEAILEAKKANEVRADES